MADEICLHGTCVALAARAVLLRGPPGSGKSDLALRFVTGFAADGAKLVADDQVRLRRSGERLVASALEATAGLLEVRGVGIVTVDHLAEAELRLIVELGPRRAVPRLPPHPRPRDDVLGVAVPVLALAPFEASAAAKLRLALSAVD